MKPKINFDIFNNNFYRTEGCFLKISPASMYFNFHLNSRPQLILICVLVHTHVYTDVLTVGRVVRVRAWVLDSPPWNPAVLHISMVYHRLPAPLRKSISFILIGIWSLFECIVKRWPLDMTQHRSS